MAETGSISVTRALVELKTLDSRIQKAMTNAVYVTYQIQNEDAPRSQVTENLYQKARDLIDYRKRLKGAIVRSNATTPVNIGGVEYTVAEAIERKNSIKYEKTLLQTMKQQLGSVTRTVENYNQSVQRKLDNLLQESFKSSQKTNLDEMKNFSETYMRSNRAEVVDPLRLSVKINELEEQILKFESEVDVALSEMNSKTTIRV
jgi:hypothetical protein